MEEENIINVQTQLGTEEIHVLRSGQGPRRFLVWHSYDSVNRFFPWRYLEQYGEVIRVGLLGHGPVTRKSWSHYGKWTQEHLIETGAAICERYASSIPLTLVGHSAGAHVALGAAMRRPSMIGSLILVDPLVWYPVNGFTRFVAGSWLWKLIGAVALAPGVRRKQRSVDAYLEGIRSIIGDQDSFYGNPNTRTYVAAGHQDYCRNDIAALVNIARICATCDLRPSLSAKPTNVPILLAHGEEDSKVPISQSEWIAQKLPQTTFVRLRGIGHVGHGEREHEFAEIVTTWLDNLLMSERPGFTNATTA